MTRDVAEELRLVLSDLQRWGEIPTQVPVDEIKDCDELGSLGIDSVAGVSLQALIEERLGVVLDAEHLESGVSFKDLAALVGARLGDSRRT